MRLSLIQTRLYINVGTVDKTLTGYSKFQQNNEKYNFHVSFIVLYLLTINKLIYIYYLHNYVFICLCKCITSVNKVYTLVIVKKKKKSK